MPRDSGRARSAWDVFRSSNHPSLPSGGLTGAEWTAAAGQAFRALSASEVEALTAQAATQQTTDEEALTADDENAGETHETKASLAEELRGLWVLSYRPPCAVLTSLS